MMASNPETALCLDGVTQFAEVETLCLCWHAARRLKILPCYEEVALGSLGGVAADLALVQPDDDGNLVFLRGGAAVTRLLGHSLTGLVCADLAAVYRDAVTAGVGQALAESRPVLTLAEGVGTVTEIVAFPLHNRWGGAIIMVFARARLQACASAAMALPDVAVLAALDAAGRRHVHHNTIQ